MMAEESFSEYCNWQEEEDAFLLDLSWDDLSEGKLEILAADPPNDSNDTSPSSSTTPKSSDANLVACIDGSPPPLKRRRMLQFSLQDRTTSLAHCDLPPEIETCKETEVEAIPEALLQEKQGKPFFYSNTLYTKECLSSGDENEDDGIEEQSWIGECLASNADGGELGVPNRSSAGAQSSMQAGENMKNGDEATKNEVCCTTWPNEVELCGKSIDIGVNSAHLNPSCENKSLVIKGAKNQTNLAQVKPMSSFVAYPFTLVKPSGVQGDITIHDINKQISSKMMIMEMPDDDQCSSHQHPFPVLDCAFVEEPLLSSTNHHETCMPMQRKKRRHHSPTVVGLTKIHTEGKGSITIVRTKN